MPSHDKFISNTFCTKIWNPSPYTGEDFWTEKSNFVSDKKFSIETIEKTRIDLERPGPIYNSVIYGPETFSRDPKHCSLLEVSFAYLWA